MDRPEDKGFVPFDWSMVKDREPWLEPCEESWYYAEKWLKEAKRSVLDLGCGLGRHSILFARYGFKVTAVDLADDALAHLKKYSREHGLDVACRKADMEHLPFADDAFDCIFAMHSAGHTDEAGMEDLMSEIARVLKPDGTVFMTLCSKESPSYKDPSAVRRDDHTVVLDEGPEHEVPHYFVGRDDIRMLFSGFELVKVRHIDDCYVRGKWGDRPHYFIEATIRKIPAAPDFSDIIGTKVRVTIDRPLGSVHPRCPDMVYPINYGYVEGIIAGDGAEQDVYVLGVDEPVKEFVGTVIAVCHRLNDNEDKWIAAPEGMTFDTAEILSAIEFTERFYDSELYM